MPRPNRNAELDALVVSYGVCAHWQRELPADVRDQLWLAHRLREDLVEVHRAHEAAKAAIWSAHPRIAELEGRIAELEQRAQALAEQAAKDRAHARSRRVDTPATRGLADVRREAREAKAARRTEINRVYEDAGDALRAAAEQERAVEKALYRVYCQDGVEVSDPGGGGARQVKLFWSVYNDVLAHHRSAVARVAGQRAGGRTAQLRHHRPDGGGALHVQLQRQAGDPVRSPGLLASGEGKWRNVLQLTQPSTEAGLSGRARGQGRARMRIGPGVQDIPVRMHRPLPAGGDATGARLVVSRVGPDLRARVQVSLAVPPAPPRPPGHRPVIALHLGWRAVEDGVKVGTWRSTLPLRVPRALRDAVRQDTPTTGWVLLPEWWRDRLRTAERVRGSRDRALDGLRARLLDHLAAHPPVEGDGWPTVAEVTRWRAPVRFARLALTHRHDPPAGREAIVAELEVWRRVDKKLWASEAHGRDWALAHRNDTYARAASWLVQVAAEVVVDDTNLADLARRSPPGPDAPPTVLEDAAAGQRTDAAPGELRARLLITAKREGVPATVVSHAGMTRTHYRCGTLNPADHDYTALRVECTGCGQLYNQDTSATLNVLAAAGHAPPPGEQTA